MSPPDRLKYFPPLGRVFGEECVFTHDEICLQRGDMIS